MTLYVYFLADKRREPARVKIGKSRDPELRARQLRTGNADGLRMLGWLPANERTEAMLHQAFRPFRIGGEWFRVWAAGLELIEAVCEEAQRRELESQLEASLRLLHARCA